MGAPIFGFGRDRPGVCLGFETRRLLSEKMGPFCRRFKGQGHDSRSIVGINDKKQGLSWQKTIKPPDFLPSGGFIKGFKARFYRFNAY